MNVEKMGRNVRYSTSIRTKKRNTNDIFHWWYGRNTEKVGRNVEYPTSIRTEKRPTTFVAGGMA